MLYQVLDWDSDFFGFGVARISDRTLRIAQLKASISQAREDGLRLLYWASESGLQAGEAGELADGLVDIKTTYGMSLPGHAIALTQGVRLAEPYGEGAPPIDCESIGAQCGAYSRFAVDESIPDTKFREMYRIWVERSLTRELADEVLIVRSSGTFAGLVTLRTEGKTGEIGLMCVDRPFRRKGYGRALMESARQWFAKREYERSEVVTQAANDAACRLYEQCGYAVSRREYFYHFWLE